MIPNMIDANPVRQFPACKSIAPRAMNPTTIVRSMNCLSIMFYLILEYFVKPPHYVEQLGTQSVFDFDRAVIVLRSVSLCEQPLIHGVSHFAALIHVLRYALLPVVELPIAAIRL
jgi:hypothetical protein